MSRSIVFPYGFALREGGVIDVFPAAEVLFPHDTGEWLSLFLIIDSGASISALPKSDAAVFGISAEAGIPMSISGIGDQLLKGWRHLITVRIGNETIRLPIAFLDSDSVPRVLGRAGIFEQFLLVFEEKQRRSGFVDNSTEEGKNIQTILDQLS